MPTSTLEDYSLEDDEKFTCEACWRKLADLWEGRQDCDDARGFQSILKKSIHYNTSRYRDMLMATTVLSKENTVGMFIENLSDLEIIFEHGSEYVSNFLSNCFLETDFCESVNNADWKTGEALKVFPRRSSIITEEIANDEISAKEGTQKGSGRQNRQITLKMLGTDWIF